MVIKIQYQIKSTTHMFSSNKERYEVRELTHECDSSKSDRENLDDAFSKVCELGGDPNKNIRWKFMTQIKYQYKGLKAIPTEWFNGVPIEHRYESCWYDGCEEVNPSDVKQRVKNLNEIVDDYGKKKYRAIVVLN